MQYYYYYTIKLNCTNATIIEWIVGTFDAGYLEFVTAIMKKFEWKVLEFSFFKFELGLKIMAGVDNFVAAMLWLTF